MGGYGYGISGEIILSTGKRSKNRSWGKHGSLLRSSQMINEFIFGQIYLHNKTIMKGNLRQILLN